MTRMEGNEAMIKTDEYVLKLKSVGLDSDPYDIPKNQWSTDIHMWPEINFGDIYMYLISSPGKHIHEMPGVMEKPRHFKAGFVGENKVTSTPKDILVVCSHVCTTYLDTGCYDQNENI